MFGLSKYEQLSVRLTELEAKYRLLEDYVQRLRNSVNRHKAIVDEMRNEDGQEAPENMNLDEIRKIYGGDIPIELVGKNINRE